MLIRYTPEQLLLLKESPLVKKPDNLPPSEEWMGPVVDAGGRTQNSRREPSDRHGKSQDGPLLDQTNRRTASDRHSRGSANPEDIILGPPKTAFSSSTSMRNANKSLDSSDRSNKDGESSRRLAFHGKLGEVDHERGPVRDGRRVRRGDGDQDGEGWNVVKPRKSFGAEGAERMFNGRMGGERHKDERRTRDSHDRDHKDRPARGFDNYSRDKDADHDYDDNPRKDRNSMGRGRNEPSWFKDKDDPPPPGRNGNGNRHVDSNRGWREKDRDDGEKGGERGDRRWNRDKDQLQEREPEWLGEADDEKKQAHTMEDFEKWKKSMKASNGDTPAEDEPSRNARPSGNGFEAGSFFGPEPPKVDTPLGIDTGPDKFFGQWAAEKKEQSSGDAPQNEGLSSTKNVGKASRFQSFFTAPPTEEPLRRVTEPTPTRESAPKEALFGGKNESTAEKDKEAFAILLQKLHSSQIAPPHSTPPANTNPPPPPANHEARPQSATTQQIPESFSPYHQERQEEQRHSARNSQPQLLDLLNHKYPMHPPNSVARPEQMVQEIINHRQNAPSQPVGRSEQARDPNSDFMLSLMQGQRAPSQPAMLPRRESQSHNAERQIRQAMDHEALMANQREQYEREQRELRDQREQRERRVLQAQRQVRKQQDLHPGFYDEQMLQANFAQQIPQQVEQRNVRPQQQPTQILQRPPPGLDNGMPSNWGGPSQQSNQLPPQVQQRSLQPPPGLPGAPSGMLPMSMQNMQNMNQNMQIPPSGFPPQYLPGMAGFEGPNGVMQRGGPGPMPPLPPPPGFFPPPPGFMQQQQGRGMPGHGAYDMNGGAGVAFLQGQLFDGRAAGGQGQGQGPSYRR